jgi:uncharacterized protein with PIN domain
MGRIQVAYASKLRNLLRRANARRLEQGVRQLLAAAERRHGHDNLPRAKAFAEVCRETRDKVAAWLRRTERPVSFSPAPAARGGQECPRSTRFLCDAGLGGLARWLRAAGYDADWQADLADADLLAETRRLGAILLTTDSMLMERRLVREGMIPTVWVPPAMGVHQQLSSVLEELGLPLRTPRCMRCGGPLKPVDKEAVRDRIPPRTYRWLDEYFLCERCGQLFWHGTHWQRIRGRLEEVNRF